MQLPKIKFEKAKVILSDGRYLLFYDFKPVSQDHVDQQTKSTQILESEGTKDV